MLQANSAHYPVDNLMHC
uniref:Uncharacterized protein n=1 Tax=Arundo donax TaxID=35708 RepID=A0A0A9B7I1_ARUDO